MYLILCNVQLVNCQNNQFIIYSHRCMNSYKTDFCQQYNVIVFHRDGILCQMHGFAIGGLTMQLSWCKLLQQTIYSHLAATFGKLMVYHDQLSGLHSNIQVLCSPAHLDCNGDRCFDFVFNGEISSPDSTVMSQSTSF